MHLPCRKYTSLSDASDKGNEVAARRSWQKEANKQTNKQKETQINQHQQTNRVSD